MLGCDHNFQLNNQAIFSTIISLRKISFHLINHNQFDRSVIFISIFQLRKETKRTNTNSQTKPIFSNWTEQFSILSKTKRNQTKKPEKREDQRKRAPHGRDHRWRCEEHRANWRAETHKSLSQHQDTPKKPTARSYPPGDHTAKLQSSGSAETIWGRLQNSTKKKKKRPSTEHNS